MREFILRVTNSQQPYEYVEYERLRYRLYRAMELGFDRVILIGEDVLYHPKIWDVVDYCQTRISDVAIMTTCRYATSDSVTKMRERDVRVLVPVQLRNPFQSEVIGKRTPLFNAGQSVDPRGLARHVSVTVWTSADGPQLKQLLMLEDQFDIGVNVHYPTKMVETEQAIGLTRWTIAHEQVPASYENGPDVEDILGKPVQYAGTMYVDGGGDVRVPLPFSNDEQPYMPIADVSDENIQELAGYYAGGLQQSEEA